MQNLPPIWLLRHGQTEWNAEQRVQGQMESCLTQLGIQQARRQAELMKPILSQRPLCFVSPLGRAQQTADIALGGAPFETDARLAEICAGDFQGRTNAEVAQGFPELFANNSTTLDLYCAAPGGEGFDMFQSRISDFLATLTGPTVVVAHALLGQVMRGIVCSLGRTEMGKLSKDQGCIYLLKDGKEQVLR
ncbi:histidine phosphatase family protein [Parasedimentitalea huanghaiensis]|uniref:Histidine phosphatase family protein n=1 Tax=Parasedimentitalea huanghaiensis TaxID=2682100 RepID=A0A6L6WIT1_9RHOB|nr:histidine phosphatase family protein [Zongyanglinia huanghaiensis]MVO15957.1 histidine phosphatase family protein [Zongyanglinia huanghaiensis]